VSERTSDGSRCIRFGQVEMAILAFCGAALIYMQQN